MYCNQMNSETRGVLCGVDVVRICHIARQHVDGITSVPFLVSTLHVLSVCRGSDPLPTQTIEMWPFLDLGLADSTMLAYHLLLQK